MRKIKLEMESLTVESFETTGVAGERDGTVHGAEAGSPRCFETQAVTGSCCDITLAQSCVQTNCLMQCTVI